MQVIKNVVPPISNEVITLVKDTSLARIITYYEIIFVAESYIRGSGILWPLLYSGVFYLVASGLLTILFNKILLQSIRRAEKWQYLKLKT